MKIRIITLYIQYAIIQESICLILYYRTLDQSCWIYGSDPRTSRVCMFKEIGWLSLQYRRAFHKCIMIYKCRNGLALQYLCDLFTSNDSMHYYNNWNSSQLQTTKSLIEYHRSFTISVLNLWNSLPRNIEESTSLLSFKSA